MTATIEPAVTSSSMPGASPGPLDGRARSLGLPSATALVIGSIGTGVFFRQASYPSSTTFDDRVVDTRMDISHV